jgi:hypothetical protein
MLDVKAGPGPMSAEEARIRSAADEAYRVLEGEAPAPPSATSQLLNILRVRTREAPLQALAAAFLLGVLFSRRR